jgi:formylglycine-generating enzyme required for sulfatase activity
VASTVPAAKVVPEMVRIPAGTFPMGSEDGEPDEKPLHDVRVATFEMDTTEVTGVAYAACVLAGACAAAPKQIAWSGATDADHRVYDEFCNDDRADRRSHPVNCVDWTMADTYCRWARKRLPTEEEWEYAARGPEGRTFPWGAAPPSPDVVNGCGDECASEMRTRGRQLKALYAGSDHWPFTSPVARYPANPFGLYDMAGNVWEWTASRYCPYGTSSCEDPRRVARGGSWQVVDWTMLRGADRSPYDPSTRNTSIGFRCAR